LNYALPLFLCRGPPMPGETCYFLLNYA